MPEDHDVPETVADLELYGLSMRTINLLGEMEYLYIKDLKQLTEREFLSWENAGPMMLTEFRTALLNYMAGKQVKSVQQCVEIQTRKPRQPRMRKKRKLGRPQRR
jgi:DNA-directed RNA polymerase alpha subunit